MSVVAKLVLSIFFVITFSSISTTAQSNQPSHESQPEWSPSGNYLTFISNRAGNPDIWMLELETNRLQNLTTDLDQTPRFINQIAWKPDEMQILFTLVTESNSDIWSYSVSSGELSNLTNSPEYVEGNAKWLHTTDKISYISDESGNDDIWMMDADGSNRENLTVSVVDEFAQSWSHDDRFIAYSTSERFSINLNIMDVSTNIVNQIVPNGGDAVWSPNDDFIALSTYDDTRFDIVLYSIETQSVSNLTAGIVRDDYDSLMPVWSIDGDSLYFVADDGENFNLIKYELDSAKFSEVLVQNTLIDDVSMSSTNRIAFQSFASGDSDIWVMDDDGENLQNLTANGE